MATKWAVIANSSFVQFYEIKGHGKEIKEVMQIEFPNGRKKSRDILSDKPGRSFESSGGIGVSHNLGKQVDPHTHEQQVFAKQISGILEKAKAENKYDELALIAPPQFLGELKQALNETVRKSITDEVKKDLPLSISEKDRMEHIAKYLNLWNR